MSEDTNETLFDFPCEFSIKAMGTAGDDLGPLVEQLLVPLLNGKVPTTRKKASNKGRYESVTVTFTAISKQQLDEIYRILSSHERLVYVL